MSIIAQSVSQSGAVSVERIFDSLQAYRVSSALKTAIDLNIFTHIAAGATTAGKLAEELQVPARGLRILCDFLVTEGMLSKNGEHYGLAPDVAAFLDRRLPSYLGDMAQFLCSDALMGGFKNFTECVQRGGAPEDDQIASEAHPVWVEFARGMSALQVTPARNLAALVDLPAGRPIKILDIAASHGQFGIALAQKYPLASLYSLDWPGVLEVTEINAREAGVGARFHKIPGDAFAVELGQEYDAVLLTNFLHHFSKEKIAPLLKNIERALNEGGQVIIAGFVPKEDRVSPQYAARFNLTVLANTPMGEAYTFSELKSMLEEAGLTVVESKPLPPGLQTLITARK